MIPILSILTGHANSANTLKLSMTQSHQVLLERPLCRVPSISIIIQCLGQSASALYSMCPNHRNLLLLTEKLTGSSPNNFLTSVFFYHNTATMLSTVDMTEYLPEINKYVAHTEAKRLGRYVSR